MKAGHFLFNVELITVYNLQTKNTFFLIHTVVTARVPKNENRGMTALDYIESNLTSELNKGQLLKTSLAR